LILETDYLGMVSRYFIFLCLLFLIVILTAISYSIQIFTLQQSVKEGLFSNLTKCSEAQTLAASSTSDSSVNIQTTSGPLPLSQYHIFASWNSACSGQFVSTQQIQNVLSTGCRFLDFPITDVSGEPMIYAPRFTNDVSSNSITIKEAMKTCMNNAFQHHITIDYSCSTKSKSSNKTKSQKYILHNYDDPLFIQLRFEDIEDKNSQNNTTSKSNKKKDKRDDKKKEHFLNKIAETVGHLTRARKYKNHHSDELSTDIPLHKLKDKIIILVDITNISSMLFKNSQLHNITNLVVGHHSGVMMYPFRTLLNSVPKNIPPFIQSSDDSSTTNLDSYLPIDQYSMAIPDAQLKTQPTIKQVIELAVYHNVHFMPFLFYQQNNLLMDYIHFFQQKKSAFLPIQSLNNILLQESEKAVMG